MKRNFLLLALMFFFGTKLLFGQAATFSGASLTPSPIPLNTTGTLTVSAGTPFGTYNVGELQILVSGDPQLSFLNVAPAGTSASLYDWVFDSVNNAWTGTNKSPITSVQDVTFQVKAIGLTPTAPAKINGQVNVIFANDQSGTGDNTGSVSVNVTAPIASLDCNTNSLTPTQYVKSGSSQTGTYRVGVTGLSSGTTYKFDVSGSGFSGTKSLNPSNGTETFIDIPITYDGTSGTVNSNANQVTVTGTNLGSGATITCNTTATITAPVSICNAGTVAPTVR